MAAAPDLTRLAETLRLLLPGEALSFDPDPQYEVDGMTPLVVARPRTPQEVAAILSAADEAGAAVLPRGAGTQTSLGMPPRRYDLALDLSRLARVLDHEPADLTVTVDAATPFADLQDALRQHRQWVPLDPPAATLGATVGGLLASNASGPARTRYGSGRDLVIGMTVALADGSIVKSGGRVVKNVAGYDMAKLHIGALGTLGVILQASFKVAPLPETLRHAAVRGDLASLSRLAQEVLHARLPLLGLVLGNSGRYAWSLTMALGGGPAVVQRSLDEVARLAGAAGAKAEEVDQPAWPAASGTSIKATVLPANTARLCTALADAGISVLAYPDAGVVHASWADAPEASRIVDLRQQAMELGGALVIQSASPELKREAGVWGETRGDFALMRRLKQQFDPHAILNPGRYVGGT